MQPFYSPCSFCYCKIIIPGLDEISSCLISVAAKTIFSSCHVPQTTLAYAASTNSPFFCCVKQFKPRGLPGLFYPDSTVLNST